MDVIHVFTRLSVLKDLSIVFVVQDNFRAMNRAVISIDGKKFAASLATSMRLGSCNTFVGQVLHHPKIVPKVNLIFTDVQVVEFLRDL